MKNCLGKNKNGECILKKKVIFIDDNDEFFEAEEPSEPADNRRMR